MGSAKASYKGCLLEDHSKRKNTAGIRPQQIWQMDWVKNNTYRIKRHVKVKGDKSIYDGDTAYWAKRLRKLPGVSTRVSTLLRIQKGKCGLCELNFRPGERSGPHCAKVARRKGWLLKFTTFTWTLP